MLTDNKALPVLVRPVTLASKIVLATTIVLGTSVPLSLFLLWAPDLVSLISLLWFGLYAAAIAGLFLTHGVNWISWLIRYRILLVLFIAGSVLTLPFSVDPALSTNRYVHFFGTTLLAIFLGFSVTPYIIMRIFAVIIGVMMVMSLLVLGINPDVGLEFHNGSQVWRGVFDNKNTMGFWASIGVLVCATLVIWSASRLSRLLYLAGAIMALGFVYMSHSAGSVIALTCAAGLMVYMHLSQQLKLGAMAMFLLAAMMIAISVIIISQVDVASIAGRSSDLTGRGEVWEQTWRLVQQRPIMGYGYGTIWYPTDETLWIQQRYTDFSWIVYHAHNGVLQMASEVGLPLTALALLFVLQQLVEIIYGHYRLRHVGALFVVGFVVAYVVSNYSEARFMQSRELFWIFFVTLPISLVRQARVLEGESLQNVPPRIIATHLNGHQQDSIHSGNRQWGDAYARTNQPDPNVLEYSDLRLQREAKQERRDRRNVMMRLSAPDSRQ